MINIKLRFSAAIFLYALFSDISQAKNYNSPLTGFTILKALHADLTGDGRDEAILVVRKESDKEQQPVLLILDSDKIIFKSKQALLPVGNDYSPYSNDGFEVEVTASSSSMTGIIDIQGETTEVIFPSTPGEHLVLRSIEENNPTQNFNLIFDYDPSIKEFKLNRIFLNINNSYCDQSLKSTYLIEDTFVLDTPLQAFNSKEAFLELKKTIFKFRSGESKSMKVMQQQSSLNFEKALFAYNSKNKRYLKEIMDSFIEDDGNTDTCPAERYIAEKYYFPDNPRWSNDLAYLFAQSGYFKEAISLLKKVIMEYPHRTVAYLNLADSYWANDDFSQAVIIYKKYFTQMRRQGKISKVPRRVIQRMDM